MSAFAAEPIIHIGSFPVTNTLLNTVFVDALLVGGALYISKTISKIPHVFQNVVEIIIETFYNLTESVSPKRVNAIFPYLMTFFLFILISNWSGLLPGAGSIGFFEEKSGEKHFVPLIRSATTDINVTLALALVSVIATHIMSITYTGFKDYITRFISLNPILLAIGALELVSEVTKIISLSFRLFGNVYAGEVVLTTVSGIFAFLFPLPFMLLEVVVGIVQALVFAMLTMAFMAILTTPHHEEKH